MNPSLLLLLGRVLLSIIFLLGGYNKLVGAEGFSGYLGALGFPAPLAMAYVVGLFELVAGAMVLLGFRVAIAAGALALFCLATALLAHMDFADQNQMNAFLKNLGLAGGFLALAATGPGAYAVDRPQRERRY